MGEPAIFATLIVSRRGMPRSWRRVAAFGLAAALYLALAASVFLSQILIVESVDAPRAEFDRVPVFHTTRVSTTGDGRLSGPAGPAPGGGGDRGAPDPAAPAASPLQPPAPRPTVVPILPPESGAAASGAFDRGGLDPDGEPGPGGAGSGSGGPRGQGCDGCPGGANGDGPGGGPGGPFDEHDPRITPPVILPDSRRLPKYPDLARRARVEGTVVLLIGIESDGRVGAVEVLRSPDPRYGFDAAAIEAVKQWRYRPAHLGGRPVAVQASVMVEFTLSR